MKNIEKSIVLGDIHYPFQDEKAVNLVLRFIKYFKPEMIFLNGDIVDFWELSKFTKPLHIEARLYDEVEKVKQFFAKLRKVCPCCKIDYIAGNHEYRMERYLADNARALYQLISIDDMLDLEKYDILYHNNHTKENYLQYGKLLIGHWDKANKHGGYTAKCLLEEKGLSLIQGHTHRGGSSFKRDYDSIKVGYENFCLCDLNPQYCNMPNWQLGFSTIHKDKDSDFFSVQQVPIIKYRILYGDKIIEL